METHSRYSDDRLDDIVALVKANDHRLDTVQDMVQTNDRSIRDLQDSQRSRAHTRSERALIAAALASPFASVAVAIIWHKG